MNKENTRQMGIDFKLFPADMIQIFHKIVRKIPERNRENATFLFHTNTRSSVDYLSKWHILLIYFIIIIAIYPWKKLESIFDPIKN